MNIAELEHLPVGCPVQLTVSVKDARSLEQREGQYGPYTLQLFTISDPTGTASVTAFDCPEVRAGHQITLDGAKIDEYERDGRRFRKIKASRGTLSIPGGSVEPQEAAGGTLPAPASPTPAQLPIASPAPAQRAASGKLSTDKAAAFLMHYYGRFLDKGVEPPEAEAMAVTLLIGLNRGDFTLSDIFASPPTPKPAPPPLEPEPEPEEDYPFDDEVPF